MQITTTTGVEQTSGQRPEALAPLTHPLTSGTGIPEIPLARLDPSLLRVS
jgi:hypothetical protein